MQKQVDQIILELRRKYKQERTGVFAAKEQVLQEILAGRK